MQKSVSTNEAEDSGRPLSAETGCFGSQKSREKLGKESWGCGCSYRHAKVARISGWHYFCECLAMTAHFRLQNRISVQDISEVSVMPLFSQA